MSNTARVKLISQCFHSASSQVLGLWQSSSNSPLGKVEEERKGVFFTTVKETKKEKKETNKQKKTHNKKTT